MLKELKKKNANIYTKAAELFRSLCQNAKRNGKADDEVCYRSSNTHQGILVKGSDQTLTNDNLPSKTDSVANRIQTTSDETPAHDVTDRVLLPVEYGNTSAQDTDDNVTSQPMAAEILDKFTGPSSPTATLSAYNVESSVSS
ncbi:hypothetical protein PoB_001007800 [Plakobranchus ocellatus]|uniref:Uncharacterized protein n=1 Tax=Plakobranchus ocellatus TaxID=259542 RepID=A0AAV3YMR8_9GAST|nr:hypothetical protein PoB_001007800 [Plakobranchus ocellatus]